MKAHVLVTRAADVDYSRDYVSLPREYGRPEYWQREDVRAIKRAVADNLSRLDQKTGFISRLKGRQVIIKPNLVSVYHNAGFVRRDYPNTTDPRVVDAVVEFVAGYAREILIVESSGRGMPTWGSFKLSGLDRLARYRDVKLVNLEEQPVRRYVLPRAKVMREVFLPEVLVPAVEGESFYISIPKMKTNMYTQVTLGFKNGMGCIPYNLRQRNHNHNLEQKIIDLLWLLRPDLVIVDGIVGAQGQCPAPVEPVDSRLLVSGDNCVETDRVAARLMGFNPADIKLFQLADADGFGAEQVAVSGDAVPPFRFRPANPSLLDPEFAGLFPRVKVLVGHNNSRAPKPDVPGFLSKLELTCRGGCLATTRLGFEFLHHEGTARDFPLTVIIGGGCPGDGRRVWYDRTGTAHGPEDIAGLPGKKLLVGNCAVKSLGNLASAAITGCMVAPNSVHMKLHSLTGIRCRVASPLAPAAPLLFASTWRMRRNRRRLIRSGKHLDWWPDLPQAEIPQDCQADFLPVPLPVLDSKAVGRRLRAEWRELAELLFY